jgi:hypothetical protein
LRALRSFSQCFGGEGLMRSFRLSIACVILLMSVGLVAEAATEITATYRLPSPPFTTFAIPFGNTGITPPAVRATQTFTAERDGWLHTASFTAASLDANPAGLSLAVTSLIGGQPDTILATAPLQGLYTMGVFSDITALNASADFTDSHVMLEANQQYALLFVADRLNSHFQVLGHQTVGTPYHYAGGELLRSASGEPFVSLPIGELMFEVTVATIPEPTTLALGLLAAAACFVRGRFVR